MENQQVLVVKKSQQIHSVEDMKDKILGAQAGSSGYLDFEAQPDLLKNRVKDQKANQYQSFNEALIDLKNDRIDALLIDRVYANYYLQSEGILNNYNVFSAGFESESFAVGVRPADKRLLTALNQAFIELYQEGKFQEISQKWFGEDVATKEVKDGEDKLVEVPTKVKVVQGNPQIVPVDEGKKQPSPEDSIDSNDYPDDATFEYKEEVDTSTPGDKKVTVVVKSKGIKY